MIDTETMMSQSGTLYDDKISYEQPPQWPEEMDEYHAWQFKAELEPPTRDAMFVEDFKRILNDKVLTAREKMLSIKGLMVLYEKVP